jgi:SAICAR synthetase
MTPKVFLLLSPSATVPSAEEVATELSARYGISDVTIRSGRVPIDRLLSLTAPDTSAVWVCYTEDGSSLRSSPTAVLLEEDSPFPVLEARTSTAPKEIAWQVAKIFGTGSLPVAERVCQVMLERRQARLVEDASYQTKSPKYQQAIGLSFDNKMQITGDNIHGLKDQQRGKVRDRYTVNDTSLALVTTDRQSGFDRMLALVPFKGAVLNMTSAFWFEKTRHIIPNHLMAVPHPNVSVVKSCQPFPIEFVVRYVLAL